MKTSSLEESQRTQEQNSSLGLESTQSVSAVFLVGPRLYLRALEEADVSEEYAHWLNDPEVTRYLTGSGQFPATIHSLKTFLQRFQNSTTDIIFAVIDRKTNLHIGNVTLNRIHWIHRTADTGIIIGRKAFWGKGYALEAWKLLLDYAFNRLGLHKVIAGALAEHEASLSVMKKLGFVVEGHLRQEFWVQGRYQDGLRLGLLQEEFSALPRG